MSTRDSTPQKLDRVNEKDAGERRDLPSVDRISLLKDTAGQARDRLMCSLSAERYLPNVTIDQRGGTDGRGNFDPRLGVRQFDPRTLVPQLLDSKYGGDPQCADPRRFADPRAGDPRLRSYQSYGADQRYGGDQRYGADPRNGGDQRSNDPRCNPEFRQTADPRYGADPRYSAQGGDQRFNTDPRYGGDPRTGGDLYRFSGDQRAAADPRTGSDLYRFSGDQRGNVDPRNGGDLYRFSGDGADRRQQPSGDQSGGRDYTVKSGDSLWKIAKNALRESGESASNRDVANAVQRIIEANKAEHPGLASNPNLILDGWHLKVPIGGDRNSTRYGGDAYFDQRGDRGGYPYGQGSGDFNGRRHSRGDWSGREYGRDQYGRDQYGRDQYGRDQYGRDQYGRDPYGRDPYGRDQYGRDPYGRDQYGRDPYGRDGNNPYRRMPGQDYGYDPVGGPITAFANALKDSAIRAAQSMGTIGRCAAGVQVALARAGMGEWMGSGNAWDMGAKMARSGKFDMLPVSNAREGDIIVRSWNRNVIAQKGGRNHGDIVVVTNRDSRGNLMGANDHHGRISPDGGRYTNSYVLRARA